MDELGSLTRTEVRAIEDGMRVHPKCSLTGDGCFVFETLVLCGYGAGPIALAENDDVDDAESPRGTAMWFVAAASGGMLLMAIPGRSRRQNGTGRRRNARRRVRHGRLDRSLAKQETESMDDNQYDLESSSSSSSSLSASSANSPQYRRLATATVAAQVPVAFGRITSDVDSPHASEQNAVAVDFAVDRTIASFQMIRPSRPTFEFARPLVIAGEAAAALWEGLGRTTDSSSACRTRLYESASAETGSCETASCDFTPNVAMETGRQSPVLPAASGAPVWLTLDEPKSAAIPSMAAESGEEFDQAAGAFAGFARVLLAVAVVFALAMGLWNATQSPVQTAGSGPTAVTPAMAAVGSNGLSSTAPSATYRTKQIGEIRTGQRVLARNPQLEQDEVAESEIDPATWRNIRLRMQKSNGGTLDIVLLRSLGWLEERAAEFDELYAIDPVDGVLAYKADIPETRLVSQEVDLAQSLQSWTSNESAPTLADQHPPVSAIVPTGLAANPSLQLNSQADKDSRWIHLAFPEIGAVGPAVVLAIEPCPPLESGEGRTVTGTFAHSAANVIDLEIEGLDTPIGCTANHPFWSEDRQDFVQAGTLKIGEHLRTESGHLVQVTRITPRRGPPVAVFNLEVDAEHVYYVSSAGVLVHNSRHYNGNARQPNLAVEEALADGTLREISPNSALVKPASDAEHHIFTDKRRKWFMDRYGIEVDDFVVDVDDITHQALHAGKSPLKNNAGWWDDELMRQIRTAEDKLGPGKQLTRDQVLAIGAELLQDFKLDHLPIHKYTKR